MKLLAHGAEPQKTPSAPNRGFGFFAAMIPGLKEKPSAEKIFEDLENLKNSLRVLRATLGVRDKKESTEKPKQSEDRQEG
jgi:hypothetical protein